MPSYSSPCLNVKYQVLFFNFFFFLSNGAEFPLSPHPTPSSLKVNACGRRLRFKPQALIKMLFPHLIHRPPCQLRSAATSPASTPWTPRESMYQKPSARNNTCSCLSPTSRSPAAPLIYQRWGWYELNASQLPWSKLGCEELQSRAHPSPLFKLTGDLLGKILDMQNNLRSTKDT